MLRLNRPATLRQLGLLFIFFVLIAFWLYANFSDSSSLIASYDPEYPYFLNSLLPFKSEPYRYIDHPGTPVELIGTGLLTLTYPVPELADETFIHYHLTHPGMFLRIARGLLLLSSLFAVYLLTSRIIPVNDWKDGIFALALGVSFYALHGTYSWTTLTIWSHNSFALPFGTTLLVLFLAQIRQTPNLPLWSLIAFGVASGWLASIQIWFAAWILGISATVFFTRFLLDRRFFVSVFRSITVGIASVFGFILGTLPILHEYLNLRDWIVRLLTHQGKYGFGEPGFTSAQTLRQNLTATLRESPGILVALFATLVLIGLALSAHRRRSHAYPGLTGIALGLSIQVFFLLFVILKHPAPIYWVSVAATLPILIGIGYPLLKDAHPKAGDLFLGLGLILLFGFVINLGRSISSQRSTFIKIEEIETEITRFKIRYAEEIGQDPETLRVFTGYGIPTSCFTLRFGDVYTGNLFLEEIDSLCPHEGRYDIFFGSPEITTSDDWDLLILPESKLPESVNEFGLVSPSAAESLGYGRVVFVTPLPDR